MKILVALLFVCMAAYADDRANPKDITSLNSVNGKLWLEMDEPLRVIYVSAYLQGYLVACVTSTGFTDKWISCYDTLGTLEHANPADPQPIVDGVTKIYAVPANRVLIIPCAIQAASMKATSKNRLSLSTRRRPNDLAKCQSSGRWHLPHHRHLSHRLVVSTEGSSGGFYGCKSRNRNSTAGSRRTAIHSAGRRLAANEGMRRAGGSIGETKRMGGRQAYRKH
jgi:hypothetical protein